MTVKLRCFYCGSFETHLLRTEFSKCLMCGCSKWITEEEDLRIVLDAHKRDWNEI
jgi:hypothetical protein